MRTSSMVDPDGDAIMSFAPSSSAASPRSLSSRLLTVVASGELHALPDDITKCESNEALDKLLTPFLPLLTRLQSSRHTYATPQSHHLSITLDATLLRVENASKYRQYAQIFAKLTPSQLQPTITPDAMTAFRRFERGSTTDRVMIVLCEWLFSASGSLDNSELFMNELFQEEIAAILVQVLAFPKLQTHKSPAQNLLSLEKIVSRVLSVPVAPILLSRLAVNDVSRVEELMDAIVAVILATTTINKTMAQQEQDALNSNMSVMENARRACLHVAKLSPLYATRLKNKLSKQTASLQCAAVAFELLTACTNRGDVIVFLYQWLKRDGAPGSALRTYVQLSTRDDMTSDSVSDFQSAAVNSLDFVRRVLLETTSSTNVPMYELSTALNVCVALQVLNAFPLGEQERLQLLQSLDRIASTSSSSRTVRLGFLVIILLWYPLAPALSKAPGQRDEHIKTALTLSQQVIMSFFQACKTDAGPLFVVSAVLFYTKVPALVPFLASVIGLNGDLGDDSGLEAQQVLRADYLHVFGDVILKPILTENLLAREVLTFPPALRVSTIDDISLGHGQFELTLRGLYSLLCEKSFLRHHHGHRLENWLSTQVEKQAALPIHPLMLSVLLEWIENYVMAFEYPIAQAPRRLQLSIVPLQSSTLTKWLSASCLRSTYDFKKGHEYKLKWARGVLGLTYALQFNQRLRQATMVAGSKLSSLVAGTSIASGTSFSATLGTGADICLHYDLNTFPLRNIVTEVVANGDQGRAFEYVAPTLVKLLIEEYPHLFDASASSGSSGSTSMLLPLAFSPHDVVERDLTRSWFRRKFNHVPLASMARSHISWTAVQMLLFELQFAPIQVVTRELIDIVNKILPYAITSYETLSTDCQVAAFCSQLASLYLSRARREQGADISLLMRLIQALCFPDVLWRQLQTQTQQNDSFNLFTYMQVLEEPFRLVNDAHDRVFQQPALLLILIDIIRDVRIAANVHVSKFDLCLLPGESLKHSLSTNPSVQQHQLVQDCLLTHGLLQRLFALSSNSNSNDTVQECRAHLCTLINELVAADAEASSPYPPRLLLAIHTQGYDVSLVPTLVANVPSMKLLWDHWMSATSSTASNIPASRAGTHGTKHLMDFVAEGADKDLPKWIFRLRVVFSLCAAHLSGNGQSAAMQQALRVVWNKLRNGVGSLGENSAGAELVHFLLKLQRQQSGAGGYKGLLKKRL
ncbi:hypothetical protein L916_07455 [Plasmopara halstedii]|uniref:Uncharacterized protein n=1 Tax=Plasmopara halstedii TaxID=4781 RepID=A0A0P1B159_PLAHL|nr:hypothetical protein L916_07455 [Plasmopara halstedii]CEG47895.1 hypothetical protein L916_07455 [Plasmopara halstedii]|eukprot:XP_024584264.1 hypothetical protein L916_07455 [Plasmopara halstedii]